MDTMDLIMSQGLDSIDQGPYYYCYWNLGRPITRCTAEAT